MEAKLIKNKYGDDFYYLMVGIDTYATTHKESFRRLSLKNCQAIELDYDLDELTDRYENINYKGKSKSYNFGFKHGFQKALEIIGDKKFSEDDVMQLVKSSFYAGLSKGQGKNQDFNIDDYVKEHLQQTEWDVEIVMETCQVMVQHGDMEFQDFPKLDADGCIILKRK